MEEKEAKTGAKKTQMFLISIGMASLCKRMYINPEVDCIRTKNYHKAWIDGGSNISTQRIPTFGVEEVPEFSEVMVDEELCGPVVEPGIKLVNDRLVSDDWEDSDQSWYRADE